MLHKEILLPTCSNFFPLTCNTVNQLISNDIKIYLLGMKHISLDATVITWFRTLLMDFTNTNFMLSTEGEATYYKYSVFIKTINR